MKIVDITVKGKHLQDLYLKTDEETQYSKLDFPIGAVANKKGELRLRILITRPYKKKGKELKNNLVQGGEDNGA